MGIHCATTEPLAGQMDKLNPTLQRLGRPMDAAAPWISSHLCPGRQHSTSVKSHQKIGYRYFVFYPFDLGRIRPPHLSRPCRAHARYHKWGALGTLRCTSTHLDTSLPPRRTTKYLPVLPYLRRLEAPAQVWPTRCILAALFSPADPRHLPKQPNRWEVKGSSHLIKKMERHAAAWILGHSWGEKGSRRRRRGEHMCLVSVCLSFSWLLIRPSRQEEMGVSKKRCVVKTESINDGNVEAAARHLKLFPSCNCSVKCSPPAQTPSISLLPDGSPPASKASSSSLDIRHCA